MRTKIYSSSVQTANINNQQADPSDDNNKSSQPRHQRRSQRRPQPSAPSSQRRWLLTSPHQKGCWFSPTSAGWVGGHCRSSPRGVGGGWHLLVMLLSTFNNQLRTYFISWLYTRSFFGFPSGCSRFSVSFQFVVHLHSLSLLWVIRQLHLPL